MSDIWQQEKNLSKAAKVLGVKNSSLHTRETTAKTKVTNGRAKKNRPSIQYNPPKSSTFRAILF